MYHFGGVVDSRDSGASVEIGDIWEFSIPSVQFFVESKTVLKNKVQL